MSMIGTIFMFAGGGIFAWLGTLLFGGLAGWMLCTGLMRYLHILQLDSYQIDGYFRSLRRNYAADCRPYLLMALVASGLELLVSLLLKAAEPIICLLLMAFVPAFVLAFQHGFARVCNAAPQKKHWS